MKRQNLYMSRERVKEIRFSLHIVTEYKQRIRNDHSKIYSQDLLNNLLHHPYSRRRKLR